jgi:DinB superfamily
MSTLPNTIATSPAEKEMLLALLRESRQRFLRSFAGVSDKQSRCRPAEGQWSILDTVEHLTVAETRMLRRLKDPRFPRSADAPNREEALLHGVADRSRKMESPEGALPTGRFANLEEAAAQFQAARLSTILFVEQSNENLRATGVRHPLVGEVSTFEMLIIMAKHAERHALQIEEIKSSPAFHAQAKDQG